MLNGAYGWPSPALGSDYGSTGLAVDTVVPDGTAQARAMDPSVAMSSVIVPAGKSPTEDGPRGWHSGSSSTARAVRTVDVFESWSSILPTSEDRSVAYVATSETSSPIATREMTPISSRPRRDRVTCVAF